MKFDDTDKLSELSVIIGVTQVTVAVACPGSVFWMMVCGTSEHWGPSASVGYKEYS